MKNYEKNKARDLRTKGYSINAIATELGVAKASVSVWVRDIVLTEKQKKKLSENGRSIASIEKRRLSRLAHEQRKVTEVKNTAKKDFDSISLGDLKLIGTILYWGEGSKTNRGVASITNSDPVMILLVMRFFREVCLVPEKKFRAHIHTFTDAHIEKTEAYWSLLTGIPRNQFYKTYIKQSKATLGKRKTLPYGTIEIAVCDTRLFHTIMGWIERIKELV